MQFEILELVQCSEYQLVYADDGRAFAEPVHVWGLVEFENGDQSVVPMSLDGMELRPVVDDETLIRISGVWEPVTEADQAVARALKEESNAC